MKTLKTLTIALGLFAAAPLATTTVGCAKKGATEETEPLTVDIGKVQLIRRDTSTMQEKNQLRYTLRMTNSQPKAITVDSVEFTYGIGAKEMGTELSEFGQAVATDEMGKVTLIGPFEWREDANVPSDNAWVRGTVNWTGGSGNARTTAFDFEKAWVE